MGDIAKQVRVVREPGGDNLLCIECKVGSLRSSSVTVGVGVTMGLSQVSVQLGAEKRGLADSRESFSDRPWSPVSPA